MMIIREYSQLYFNILREVNYPSNAKYQLISR